MTPTSVKDEKGSSKSDFSELELFASDNGDGALDPVESLRIRRKIDCVLMPLMCILYFIQYLDKSTLGSSSILGILTATHLDANELSTVFYLSYLVFEYPQNLALQRFPVGRWLSVNIFIWSVALCCHAACRNFRELVVVRIILGMCEGSITAGFLLVSSMFYTRNEQMLRVGYWYLMNGTAQIATGFISFGVLHIQTKGFQPWQWLMIITGILSFMTATAFWFLFPDSPTTAWFLTPEERATAIQRVKVNQTGVGNKHFKKEQFYEAIRDPKTWGFALFSGISNVTNSISAQAPLITASFGFTYLQTSLLGIVSGLIEIFTIWTGVNICARIPNSRDIGAIYILPNIAGLLMVNLINWNDRIALLAGQYLNGLGTTSFVLMLSWLNAVTAGQTKKITAPPPHSQLLPVNAIMLCAYCIGNAVGPFMWKQKYKPRNHVPWTVIGACYVSCITLLLLLRLYMSRENRKRDAEPQDENTDTEVYVKQETADGGIVKLLKVDKGFLDMTDVQNRSFRYVL
ncbi:MFS general substrate transporter [Lentinula guzmanii]|uniref:MFS general substrate transporter n=1 Tax=Lentinula guzmanii TaxID=2804957 RepID=A0AA38JCQ4_9AGAR|nr:MFS general substrate transporter [Lentinula guzmanii]